MTLRVKNLHKAYGDVAVLKGVSLEIEEGKSYAIMGASGEGKTTLLHILGSLENLDSGEITVDKDEVGFIFQSYNLLEDFSLLENILMPIRIRRKNVKTYTSKALMLIKKVGLKGKENRQAKVLSGGEKQRAAIARALITDPKVILADEPTGNLDHYHSDVVEELLTHLSQVNKSVVIATHSLHLAQKCDVIYELNNGEIFPVMK